MGVQGNDERGGSWRFAGKSPVRGQYAFEIRRDCLLYPSQENRAVGEMFVRSKLRLQLPLEQHHECCGALSPDSAVAMRDGGVEVDGVAFP